MEYANPLYVISIKVDFSDERNKKGITIITKYVILLLLIIRYSFKLKKVESLADMAAVRLSPMAITTLIFPGLKLFTNNYYND